MLSASSLSNVRICCFSDRHGKLKIFKFGTEGQTMKTWDDVTWTMGNYTGCLK